MTLFKIQPDQNRCGQEDCHCFEKLRIENANISYCSLLSLRGISIMVICLIFIIKYLVNTG